MRGVGVMSRKYLDWVRTLDCAHCGAPADDPHHIKGVGHFSGIGRKAADWLVMPLCRPCHNAFHEQPELWSLQWEYITRTLDQAFLDGVVEFRRAE